MRLLKYIFLFVLFGNVYYAQKSAFENIDKITYERLEDEFYVNKDNNNYNQSQRIALYYLQKAKKDKNRKYIAEGYILMHYNKNLSTALKYIDSVEVISKSLNDNRYPARIYLLKGFLYYNEDSQKDALENFVSALKYAKENNNKRQIAIADIQIAYLNSYIGKANEAATVLQHYYDNPANLSSQDIEHIRINLADTYLDINENEKAKKLIDEGLLSTQETNDNARYNRYLSILGEYYLRINKYPQAISNLEKCKEYFLKKNFTFDANYAMLYLGQSYAESGDKDKAVNNFMKIDSIVQETNNTFPELRDVYTYLIDYFKEKKDKEHQLDYIERFLKVDKVLDSQFKYVSRELPRKYDTPNLLTEKERIISELENKRYLFYVTIGVLCLLLITLAVLFTKVKRAEKRHKKIAQELIQSVNENRNVVVSEEKEEIHDQKVHDLEKNKLSDDLVKNILQELEIFEEKKHYLKKGITLSSLAKSLKTNSSYLSEVVNTYKEKNLNSYLNDLRINYSIKQLATDKKLRSLKIAFIAEELGYNNEQAFTKAFKKKTGITVSTYIQEINKSKPTGSFSNS